MALWRPSGSWPIVGAVNALALAPPVIETTRLTKQYNTHAVVADLDLYVPTGSVAGFIGRNGAGKTTAMRMLLGLIRPTSGTGQVLGQSLERPAAYLDRVGAMIEGPSFHPALSARDNLRVLTRLAGFDDNRIDETLAIVELSDRADDRFRSFSLGMKQRLGIAASLLSRPELIVLDEPTNGLDPQGIADIRVLLRRLADDGATVFVSSHLLAEIEHVCNYLVVIDAGRLRFQGAMDALTDRSPHHSIIAPEETDDTARLIDLLELAGLHAEPHARGGIAVSGATDGATLNRLAATAGITLGRIEQSMATLEDAVLALTATNEEGTS